MSCLDKKQDARPTDARALRDALRATRAAGDWTAEDAAASSRDIYLGGLGAPRIV